MARAEWNRRPVTMTISMPRSAASAIARGCQGKAGEWLSSRVPSISIAISLTANCAPDLNYMRKTAHRQAIE